MKKALFFAGLAASLLFVGCNKEADFAGNGRPVGITLSDALTRTVNDGLATKWEDGDALNVFYAAAGTEDYSKNTKFTVDDADANHAAGTAELGTGSYDWYLLYPYSSYIKTPANTNSGYLTVGSKSNEKQSQAGLDSKAHLAGANLPVYGVAKGVAADATIEVAMKQVVSVVAVNLTNGTTDPLSVDEVAFTAPEEIIGTFYIDISGEELAFAGSGANYVSKTAELTVTDATLAAGASAKFYIAVKPFAANAGDKLAVKVKSGESVFEKEISLPSAVKFQSGHIKQINITYTGGEQIQGSTLEEIIAMANDTDVLTQEVLVVGKYARGIMLGQNGTFLLAFNGSGVDAAVGDIVTVSGKVGEYAGLKQIANPEVTVISSGNEVVLPEPKDLTANMDEYASEKVEMIQFTGTLSVSGNYYNVIVAGATKKGSIQYPLDTEAMAALNGKAITASGFFTGFTGSGAYVNMMSTSVGEAAVNVFDVTPEQIDVAATATSTEITVTGNVDWTAEASEGATVDPASGTGNGTITVTFPANTDAEHEKTYSVAVRTTASGVNDEFIVDITQAKADASGVTTATVDFSAKGYENGYEMPATSVIDGVTFSFDKGDNKNAPKYYTTGSAVRLYGGNSMTVSVEGKTLISIGLTFDSGESTNAITTDVPTYEEPTWTGEAPSVTFTVGGTSGHRRIKTVTVKYKDGGSTPTPVDPTVTVPSTLTVVKGETATIEVTTNSTGAKTWASSDETVATVDNNGVVTGVKAGTATVTLSIAATSAYKAATAEVAVTVTEPATGGNTVSMTMSEYVAANNCTVSAGSDVTVYPILQLNESVRLSTTGTPGCGSFWNTSSTNETKQWRLYQKQNGNAIVSVAEGCELVSVKLTYTTTNNGVLIDAAGNQVASDAKQTVSGSSVTYTVGNTGTADNGQVRVTAIEVVYTGNGTSFPQTEITTSISMAGTKSVYIGETVALEATSNVEGATITYESEDTNIATVSSTGVVTGVAEGTVKVYARIAAVPGEYTAAERYCTVTVSKKPEQSDYADVFIFSELGYANATDVTTVEGKNVTLLFAQGEGSNAPKYYDSGTAVRMYSKNTLNISSAKTIKKVEFSCVNNYGINDATTFSAGTCTDGVWEGSAKSIDILNGSSSQIRIVSIKVTYE